MEPSMWGVMIIIYPELEGDIVGMRELVHPYVIEGSIVSAIGIVALLVGFGLYAVGRNAKPVDVTRPH